MSCGLWRPVEPLHDSIHCYNFNVPDPPPNDPPPLSPSIIQSNKVKLRKKPQQQNNERDIGEIVESIILTSDRFYNQSRVPCRREFTLSGVRRVVRSVCLESNYKQRAKSFLWDDWKRKSLPSSVLNNNDDDDDTKKIALLNEKAKCLSDSLIKHKINGRLSTDSLDLKKICEDFILAEKYAYFIAASSCSNHSPNSTKTTFSSMKTLGSDNVFYPHGDVLLIQKPLSNFKVPRSSNSSIDSSSPTTLSINFDNIRVDGFNNKVFELRELKRRQEQREAEERARLEAEEAARQAALKAASPSPEPADTTDTTQAGAQAVEEEGQERPSPTADDEDFEGNLVRKHEWESTTKKASNRSWDKVYSVLKGSMLGFYKDSKTAKSSPEQFFKGEQPLDLVGATVKVADDYTKKKHVLRLRLSNGAEFLFQAHDDAEMNTWVQRISAHCESSFAGPSRSQTLPSSGQKDEPKRRSFFTLKKN